MGWREEDNGRIPPLYGELPKTESAPPTHASGPSLDPSKKYVTQEMATQHTTRDSVWFVHEGKVYDATLYLDDHPGKRSWGLGFSFQTILHIYVTTAIHHHLDLW